MFDYGAYENVCLSLVPLLTDGAPWGRCVWYQTTRTVFLHEFSLQRAQFMRTVSGVSVVLVQQRQAASLQAA